jgi:beta-carotene 3-hydroxylase
VEEKKALCHRENHSTTMLELHHVSTVLLTLIGMEVFSWLLHKYIFHGPLWFIHQTHHNRTVHNSLELNDIFSVGFASLAIAMIYIGYHTPSPVHFNIGLGITIYGMIYFIIHDGLIHQRYPIGNKTSNAYIRQVQRAHQRHHIHAHKAPSEEFGLFFIIGRKYWRDVFAG